MKNINILAIDPSGYYKNKKATIGVALCRWKNIGKGNIVCSDNLVKVKLMHYVIENEKDLENFYTSLGDILKSGDIYKVVIEDYILYADKVGPQVWQQQPTSKTIGVISYLCNQNNVPYVLQIPALAKRWTNKVLSFPTWGFLIKEKNSFSLGDFKISKYRHAMDAFRHNFYWASKYNKFLKDKDK